ncbi:MAG: hypothetical protein U9P49_13805 [Thermodesulfobacteriota bacterium]|nr:hypothetical protein [Thermodesulfobacteriota bacterium]
MNTVVSKVTKCLAINGRNPRASSELLSAARNWGIKPKPSCLPTCPGVAGSEEGSGRKGGLNQILPEFAGIEHLGEVS